MDNRGYIYVLANSSMPDLVKVGKTTRSPSERAQELSGVSGIPTPFIVVYEQLFEDCSYAEDFIHTVLKQRGYRETDTREFFRAPVSEIIHIISKMHGQIIDSIDYCNEMYNYKLISNHQQEDLNDLSLDAFPKSYPYSNIWETAENYYFGLGDCIQDYAEAMKLYREAVKLGCSMAYLRIGDMYRYGFGVPANEQRALDYYKKGVMKGNYYCYWEMGVMYYWRWFSTSNINNIDKSFKCMNLYFKKRKELINPEIEEKGRFYVICTDYIVRCIVYGRHPSQEAIEQMAVVTNEIIEHMNEMLKHFKEKSLNMPGPYVQDVHGQAETYWTAIKWVNKNLLSMVETTSSENNSNEFLGPLNQVISEAKKLISSSPAYLIDYVQKEAINIVEKFFYSNLTKIFLNNLTENNIKELDIAQEDVEKLKKQIFILCDSSESTLEEGTNNEKINYQIYQKVKEELFKNNNQSYKLLVVVENHIDLNSCEELIHKFREDIKANGLPPI